MAQIDALLPEYDHEIGTTRRLLERAPEREFAWKPHEKSMSLGRLVWHLAEIPSWGGTIVDGSSYDLAAEANTPPQAEQKSRAEMLAVFDQNAAAARAAIAPKTDAELLAPWTLKKGRHDIFTLPKVAVLRNLVLNHLIHHRGQLSVYLRLKDIPIPAIYGPSADEGR